MNNKPSRGSSLLSWFLDKPGVRRGAFAADVDCTTQAIRYWCSGARKPGVEQAVAISRATNGEVPVEAWTEPVS